MKSAYRSVKSLFIIAIMMVLAIPITLARAYFAPSTHQAATRVLGQPNFTSSGFANTLNRMRNPSRVAVDPTTHKVFVADTYNSRVLRFASLYALTNGAAAEAVLGDNSGTTQSGLSQPRGVFVDAGEHLWVSDTNNNRVLRFDDASTITSGAIAHGVLGQPDFKTPNSTTTQTGMALPQGVFVDTSGRLWVVDSANVRILRFDNAANKANGDPADAVLGQPDFIHNDNNTTPSGMSYPTGVTGDAAGNLWVADPSNDRVVRFNNAASKPNGGNADAVLGQATLYANTPALSQNGLHAPFDVTLDPKGNLYVADESNNRIVVFNGAAGLGNGANANYVLGQPNFTTGSANSGGISASSLNTPSAVSYDPFAGVLFAADYNNNRVLMYGKPSKYLKPYSTAANDGWVLESTATSSVGGSLSAAGTLRIGDDASKKQYRSILSFNTAGLPDTGITIHSVTVNIKKAGHVGADPLSSFGSFGYLLADIKKGAFGAASLEKTDFQNLASANAVGQFTGIGLSWYQMVLPAAHFSDINRTGVTQFRLRFAHGDNGNNIADYDTFFAGDSASTANHPVLTVVYTLP